MRTRKELKEIRCALGLTQADVAKGAGVCLVSVIKYEAGRSVRPSTERAIRDEIERKLRLYNELLIV